eukprot:UN20577
MKEEFTFSFIETVLHANIVAAASAFTTITRLADLLISIETSRFGLIVNDIQTMFSESGSRSWNSTGKFGRICRTWRLGRTCRTSELYSCSRVGRGSSVFAAVVQNASGCRSDVKEEFTFSFIKTMLHTSIVAAPSTSTTITRLADLLISIGASFLGLVINHIQAFFLGHCESPSHRFSTDDFDSRTRVSRNSGFVAAVVEDAS